MTAFYKVVEDNFVAGFGTNGGDEVTGITETEYNALAEMFADRPTAPEGYAYMIQDDPREWVLVELPPDPDEDIDDAEAFAIIFGGGAE
jgi:hypothetical protein